MAATWAMPLESCSNDVFTDNHQKSLLFTFRHIILTFPAFSLIFHEFLIQSLSVFGDHRCDSNVHQYFATLPIFEIFIDIIDVYQCF